MWRASAAAALIFGCLLHPASAASADQAKGTLTIGTQSSDVWFNVHVVGAFPPAPAKLADAAGEHAADVTVTEGPCPAARHAGKREIGLTGATWCVHVSHLQAGYAVSGTLASPFTSLSLTVKRKDGPLLPLLWSIAALVTAVLISALSTTYVPGLTSKLRLRLYERDGGIAGLGDWVKTAAADGILSDDDIVARAKWARKYGPRQVMKIRRRLAKAVDDADPALRDSPLGRACRAEAGRKADDATREDVLTDQGARSTKAADLLDSLTKANTAIRDFTSAANEIIAALQDDPAKAEQAEKISGRALGSARDLSEEGVPQFVTNLSAIVQSMRTTFSAQQLALPGAERLVAAAASGAPARVTIPAIAASVKEAFEPVVVYAPALLLALVVMAGAVATVFSAQYLANPNFGTLADYWALILSAYGSAQATAIAAALLLIRTPKPWYG